MGEPLLSTALLNEGLKMVRDRKMQEITSQRKRRNTLQSMVNLQSDKTGCCYYPSFELEL